jgi:hypothetical protein
MKIHTSNVWIYWDREGTASSAMWRSLFSWKFSVARNMAVACCLQLHGRSHSHRRSYVFVACLFGLIFNPEDGSTLVLNIRNLHGVIFQKIVAFMVACENIISNIASILPKMEVVNPPKFWSQVSTFGSWLSDASLPSRRTGALVRLCSSGAWWCGSPPAWIHILANKEGKGKLAPVLNQISTTP